MVGDAPRTGGWRHLLSGADARVLRTYQRPRDQDWGLDGAALLVVDAVAAFVGPDLPVEEAQRTAPTACGHFAWAALPHVTRLLTAFREQRLPVVFTTPSPRPGGDGGATRGGGRAAVGPQANEVVAPLRPEPGEPIVAKTRASAFFATPLVSLLVSWGVRSLVLAGGTTSGCVKASAVDGTSYGFDVIVAEEACFDRVSLLHDVGLLTIDAKYGRVVSCDEVCPRLLPGGRQVDTGVRASSGWTGQRH